MIKLAAIYLVSKQSALTAIMFDHYFLRDALTSKTTFVDLRVFAIDHFGIGAVCWSPTTGWRRP
jgi:hypothetical protein